MNLISLINTSFVYILYLVIYYHIYSLENSPLEETGNEI